MIKLNENDLFFAKIKPEAIIPTKKKENAGYDVYACFDEDYLIIPPHTTKLIPTCIAAAICDKYYLGVAERGSTGKIGMKYSAGIIDSGYRGEIFIAITNTNDVPVIISKLKRIELEELYGEYTNNEEEEEYRYEGVILTDENYDENYDEIYLEDYSEYGNMTCIIYPYSKAIAQLIVHEVHNEIIPQEIPYEDLLEIPSERGNGSLGSTGK